MDTPTEELTDAIISVAQNILHEKFPDVEGFQDTTLGPLLDFSVHGGEFVQVLHTGGHHWVTVSNVGCHREVNYYDSLARGKPSAFVQKQVACMLQEK